MKTFFQLLLAAGFTFVVGITVIEFSEMRQEVAELRRELDLNNQATSVLSQDYMLRKLMEPTPAPFDFDCTEDQCPAIEIVPPSIEP